MKNQTHFALLAVLGFLFGATSLLLTALPQAQTVSAASSEQSLTAASSTTFAYQGTLRDSNGKLLTGTFNLTFAIYDQSTGGTVLHEEVILGVIVRDGNFNVVLGTNSFIPLGPMVFAAQPRYIGIAVQPDPEMTPRQEIHAVPWAQHAIIADSAKTVQSEKFVIASNGFVGIGTTSPASELDINGQLTVSGQRVIHVDSTNIALGDIASSDGSRALELRAGDDSRIYVAPNGNVGIGTTSPTAKLQVAGNISFSGQKACSIIASWRDTILVPSSWTAQTCDELRNSHRAVGYTLMCIFENSFSEGSDQGGLPNPNCGW